jgi:hypothetical protein
MLDPNLRDFQGRVARIEKTHAAGGGFEADGTLGLYYYNSLKVQRRRGVWLFPTAMILATILFIKAGVLASIGAAAYGDRIAGLNSGGMVDIMGAWVLQADPLTVKVAALIQGIGI